MPQDFMEPSPATKEFIEAHPEVPVIPVPKPQPRKAAEATRSDPRDPQPVDEE